MNRAITVAFSIAAIPIVMFASALTAYAVFNPVYWLTALPLYSKALHVGTLLLALGMVAAIKHRRWFEQHRLIVGVMFALALVEPGIALPSVFRSLGQF